MEQRSSQNKGQILTGSRLTDTPESMSRTHVNAESMDVPSCLTYMTLLQGDSDAGGGAGVRRSLPYMPGEAQLTEQAQIQSSFFFPVLHLTLL